MRYIQVFRWYIVYIKRTFWSLLLTYYDNQKYLNFLFLFIFFFKEILVQDHFFRKYSVNHISILNWIYLSSTSDDEIMKFYILISFIKCKKSLSVRCSKNIICSFVDNWYFFSTNIITKTLLNQRCRWLRQKSLKFQTLF